MQNRPIGLELKELARQKKMPVADIATALNISPQGVYDIFKRKSIGSETLRRVCEVIGTDPNELLGISFKNKASDSPIDDIQSLKAKIDNQAVIIAEQSKRIEEQREQIAQQSQMLMALIQKLGKYSASESLAVLDA